MSTKKLKLYRISQDSNTGYDTYDSAVVAAPDPTTAAQIHPDGDSGRWSHYAWCSGPEYVEVELIGTAAGVMQGVICASFNAG
jgi:hypothetical protein